MAPLPASSLSPVLDPAAICESAARLLFMNVRWARSVPSFTQLPPEDQLLLLEESWRDLFVLGAVQFLQPIELGALVRSLDTPDNEKTEFLRQVKEFQEVLSRLQQLQVDPHELACLRAIVLFRAEKGALRGAESVRAVQEHTQLTLSRYVGAAHPAHPLRFGRLLLSLPALRTVRADTIEELFFRKTIGDTPIVRIICDMYKSNPNLA